MINNYELIKPLLDFSDPERFYFLQILMRKKDHNGNVNGTNNNSRLVKPYYISSENYFDFIMPEVIAICDALNARAMLNLNRRSWESAHLQHVKKLVEQMEHKEYTKSYKAYSHVVGKYQKEEEKSWIIDIDNAEKPDVGLWNYFLCDMQPVGNKVKALLPTKNGWHLITSPFHKSDFNLSVLKDEFGNFDLQPNNPTNLYIP